MTLILPTTLKTHDKWKVMMETYIQTRMYTSKTDDIRKEKMFISMSHTSHDLMLHSNTYNLNVNYIFYVCIPISLDLTL